MTRDELARAVALLPDGATLTLPVEALRAALAGDVPESHAATRTANGGPDRMVTAKDVAERLGIDLDSVYQLAPSWPWAYKVSARRWRFSERGLGAWLCRQQG